MVLHSIPMAFNQLSRNIGLRQLVKCIKRPQDYESMRYKHWANTSVFKFPVRKSLEKLTRTFSSQRTDFDVESVSCWKCGVTVDLKKVLFCNRCDVVQKPKHNLDYFEILGVEKQFDINSKKLTQNFRLLQMQLHPDRFSQKSEVEKEISAEYSSLLNQAYKTLNSPLDRGLYLLEINGLPLKEGEDISFGPDFLSEIMEINEELHQLDNLQDYQRLRTTNQMALDKLYKKVAEGFTSSNLVLARESLARLKYYSRIHEKIKELQHEFE